LLVELPLSVAMRMPVPVPVPSLQPVQYSLFLESLALAISSARELEICLNMLIAVKAR
jgi:hypothetical protein